MTVEQTYPKNEQGQEVQPHGPLSTGYQMIFEVAFDRVQKLAHEQATAKGFWETDRGDAEAIALMHSELSEALEYIRHGNPQSDHIPGFSGAEEEYADVIIRIMDTAAARGLRVGAAINAKLAYNASRPHKHGKNF